MISETFLFVRKARREKELVVGKRAWKNAAHGHSLPVTDNSPVNSPSITETYSVNSPSITESFPVNSPSIMENVPVNSP